MEEMPHHLHSSPTGFCGSSRPHIQFQGTDRSSKAGHSRQRRARFLQMYARSYCCRGMPCCPYIPFSVIFLLCDPPLRCQVAQISCIEEAVIARVRRRSQARRRRSGRYCKECQDDHHDTDRIFSDFPRFIFDSCPDLPVTVVIFPAL